MINQGTGRFITINKSLVSLKETDHLFNSCFLRGVGVFDAIYAFSRPEINEVLIFRLNEHVNRLVKSSKLCDLRINVSTDTILKMAIETVSANKFLCPQYIDMRIICFSSHPQEVNYSDMETTLVISVHKMHQYIEIEKPIKVAVIPYTRDPVFGKVKIVGQYAAPAILHSRARKKGFATVVFMSHAGVILESSFANIFGVWNNVLRTPSLNLPIVDGITRSSVLSLASKNDIRFNDTGLITEYDLANAQELFLTGTSTKITPIVEVAFFSDYSFDKARKSFSIKDGCPGKITKFIRDKYEKATSGKDAFSPEWITRVTYK